MSGNVMYLEANRVRPLGLTMVQAMGIVKRIGVGSGQALHGVERLGEPADAPARDHVGKTGRTAASEDQFPALLAPRLLE